MLNWILIGVRPYFLAITVALLYGQTIAGQEAAGLQTGNFAGMHGVLANPAYVAQSKYRWDVNILTINSFAGNAEKVYGLDHIQYFRKPIEFIKNSIPKGAGQSDLPISTTIVGPCVMMDAGVFSGAAITTRLRFMGGAQHLDRQLLNQFANSWAGNIESPFSFNQPGDARIDGSAWAELGVTYGVVLLNNVSNYLKMGVTARYLGGIAGGYFKMHDVKGLVYQDHEQRNYLEQTYGRLDYASSTYNSGSAPSNFSNMFVNRGVGGDVGFIYEYHPARYQVPDEEDVAKNRDIAGYKFRAGAALLDVGRIKFERDFERAGEFFLDINGSEQVYFDDFAKLHADSLQSYMIYNESHYVPDFKDHKTHYFTRMPTRIRTDLDLHIGGNLYLNFEATLPVRPSKNIYTVVHAYPSRYALTPRFEGKQLGVFMPVNFTKGYKPGVGLALRAGPLVVGSSNLLALARSNAEIFHAFAGLRIYGLQHSHVYWYKRWFRKVNRWKKGSSKSPAIPYGF